MIKRSIIAGCLLAVLGLLAACGTNTNVEPTATVPPYTPIVAATSTPAVPASTAPLITFEMMGGIAGMQEKMVIRQNGDVVVSQRGAQTGTGHLDATRLTALQTGLDAIHFFDLKDKYDEGGVADDRYMTLTYSDGTRIKSVTVAEVGGQKTAPPELKNFLAQLQQIATEAEAAAAGSATPAGPETTGTPVPLTPTEAMPPQTTAVPPTPVTPSAAQPLITYELTGGIAGMRQTLVIAENGDTSASDRGTVVGTSHLAPDRLAALEQQFAAVHFFDLKDRYDEGAVSDDRYITVTYREGGQSKSVTIAEIGGQQVTPPELTALLAELERIAAETRDAGTPTPST
jgi:hypothetical protein